MRSVPPARHSRDDVRSALYTVDIASIPFVFSQVAQLQPDAIALRHDTSRVTYAELDSRSSALARRLVGAGVRVGDRVGVCLAPSIGLIVALLAAMKCGAAYVPLDPEYPEERLKFIADDANIAALISDSDILPGFGRLRVQPARGGGEEAVNLPHVPQETTAYIIYTSGSTGRPKGVMIPHRNVVALLRATAQTLGLCSGDIWSAFHTFAFDFSVWEIWGALLTGGQLVIVPRWSVRDPEEFLRLLAAARVTVLSQTPSAFSQLAALAGRSRNQLKVRLLVFGGELLDARILGDWFACLPDCRVENMYGITETTVHATMRTLTARDAASGCRSAGRPLPGWEIFVVDESGHPLPPEEAGEICVAGAGLADGYLGLPGLTAEYFVPDRISPHPGRRMYRSGDIGRMNANGELECLGRIDEQVKIRGHRIELGEIRAILQRAPDVAAAAVVVNKDAADGTARIDAYVAAQAHPNPLPGLRALLHSQLPHYMLPTSISRLDELPLTPNGKLDAPALPAPPAADGPESAARHQPLDPRSAALARMWSDLLGTWPRPNESFFELGGNSLLMMRLKTLIGQELNAMPTLRELYSSHTLAAMTKLISGVAETE